MGINKKRDLQLLSNKKMIERNYKFRFLFY